MIIPSKVYVKIYSKILGSVYCFKAAVMKGIIENDGCRKSFVTLFVLLDRTSEQYIDD